MGDRPAYFIVGLFVIAGTAVLVGMALWIGGDRLAQESRSYRLLFEQDVSGLGIGSPVRFLGVRVGEVADLSLEADSSATRVIAEISVAAQTPIDAGTYATLSYEGITGVAFINLAEESGRHGPLEPADPGEAPLIPTRHSGLSALLAESDEVATEVRKILDQTRELLSAENRAALSATLANSERITGALAAESETLAALPARLLAAAGEMDRLARESRTLVSSAGPEITAAVAGLRQAADDVAAVTARADERLASLPALTGQLEEVLGELDRLLQRLNEDPSRLLHRRPDDVVHLEQ
ncbi:MAG TPA: MlaD family protein [Woeseiaceae bacterium]|nr:MlaD family protein [Woeseiaceae bacterium]